MTKIHHLIQTLILRIPLPLARWLPLVPLLYGVKDQMEQ
jgi:hypothetical protein